MGSAIFVCADAGIIICYLYLTHITSTETLFCLPWNDIPSEFLDIFMTEIIILNTTFTTQHKYDRNV